MFGLRLVIPILVAIVSVGGLVALTGTVPSKRLRRSAILYLPYFAACLALLTLEEHRTSTWHRVLLIATEFVELLLIINLSALVIFDVGFRLLRFRIKDILHDLAVAAAYIVAIVWVMHRADFNLASIVATSAVVTAVIGLSLQSTLGNVIGGLALQVDDSISEGDWIELENKQQGQVKKVRWRHTVIETREWDTLFVPNSQLLNQTIKLLGKRSEVLNSRRMSVHFNVDFRFSPTAVIDVLNRALSASPVVGAARDPKPHALILDLARDQRDSFGYYAVRYWLTDLASDDQVSSKIREVMFAALGRAKIPLAVPASAIFLSQETEARSEAKRARSVAEVRRALGGASLFAGLAKNEIDALADSAELVRFAPQELIATQGERAECFYVLAEGTVEIRVASEEGQERRVATLKAPDFFGEMALMSGAEREATVAALDDVVCVRVNKPQFKELLAVRPELANELSHALAQRKVELEAARENLDADTKKKRLASERGRILAALQEFFGLGR